MRCARRHRLHERGAVTATLIALLAAAAGAAAGWQLARHRRRAPPAAPAIDPLAAAAAERERIYADLHDDLGAKLLQLIYQAESPRQADLARAILQDLRDVVTRSRGTPGTLGDVLADIHGEAQQRLQTVGIGLAWEIAADLPDPPLDHGRALHLYRIVREAISNVIRHAEAQRLRVRVRYDGAHLLLELTDDGSGAAVGRAATGGMRTMRDRAAALEGDIRWVPGTERGTKVLLQMPLAATEPRG